MVESEPGVRLLPAEIVREWAGAHRFPDPRRAGPEGLLAWGGDLSPARLIAAYAAGIFPWYEEPPILWFSPDPRVVLVPSRLRINRSLARSLRRQRYEVRFDSAFREVIEGCATVPRPGQRGTWITADMIDAYCALHALGLAHSVESWQDGRLVGGVYGVSLGGAFFGESMFARADDASKVALVHLLDHLGRAGFHFLDCQAPTPHTERLGAEPWPRERFLEALGRALREPTRCGVWSAAPVRPAADAAAHADERTEPRP